MKLVETPPSGYLQRVFNYGPYSPSRLIAAKCPSRFFAQYVRKDKVVASTIASARGSAIHEVLEKITKNMQEGLILTVKQVNDWVEDAVAKNPAAYSQIDLVKKAADAYIQNPSPYIKKNTFCEKSFAIQLWYEDTWDDTSPPQILFVPVPYALEDGKDNPNRFFGGKIDQLSIDEELKIVTILDHKSTPSANENEDHTFQVGCYAWLVSLFYPGYKMKTVIHYCHPALNFYSSPIEWSPEDLRFIQDEIIMKINALENYESFPALPSNQCDYCHIVQECSVFTKVRDQKAKGAIDLNTNSVEDLIRIGQELYVVDHMYSQLSTALKDGITKLCPNNGVNIGGVSYGYHKSEGVDWNATDKKISEESRRAKSKIEEGRCESEEDLASCQEASRYSSLNDVLISHGVNPDNFKNWNGTKLKNIWKLDKPELIETLRKVIVFDGSTKFGPKK